MFFTLFGCVWGAGTKGSRAHNLHLSGLGSSKMEITSKRNVRSSVGAYALYPLFGGGGIRVQYPKVWYRMTNVV